MKLLPFSTSNGIQMRKTLIGANGVICRDGTLDLMVSKEINRCYKTLPVSGKIVLDIGGNIGAFARWAILNGAKQVISIEPEQSNFECLLENTKGLNVVCLRGCLDLDDGFTKIYLSTGTNPGNTTQTPRRGRFEQTVPKVSFHSVMSKYKPESVKVDCEGAEYNIGRASMWPHCVKNVCGEVHINGFGRQAAMNYINEYSGWKKIITPKVSEKAWHTIVSWERQ
jgi:FkbM family methyltransferase